MKNFKLQIGVRLFVMGLAVVLCNPVAFLIALLFPFIQGWTPQLGILLNSVGGGIGTTTSFDKQFVPQFLWFTTTANPDIKINVAGDGVIWDITGVGVNEFATIRQMSRTTNFYLLQIAGGLILPKTVTFSITNQTAAAFNVYGFSQNSNSPGYCTAISQVVQAPGGTSFTDFAYIAFPNAGATDQWIIWYKNGTQQIFNGRDELRALLQKYQNSITTVGYNIDNVDQEIKRVEFLPAATQTVFVQKYGQAKGTFDSTLIARA